MRQVLLLLAMIICSCEYTIAQSETLDRNKLPKTIYLHDDFDDNQNGWSIFDHSQAKGYIIDGEYHLENKQENKSYLVTNPYNIDPSSNCYIEMEFSVTKGSNKYGSGLIFNRTTTTLANRWAFLISPEGKFKIFKTIDSVNTDVKEWTASSYIHQEGKNRLAINKRGGKTYFYINDELVFEMKSPAYIGTGIGFMFARASQVGIDNFTIRYDPAPINQIADAEQGYEKIPLGTNINRDTDQSFPILSADGKTMCFSRIINGGFKGLDTRVVLYSEYNDTKKEWSEALPFPANINNRRRLQIVYLSPDKKTIIINGTYGADGKPIKGLQGISMSHKTADGWSAPEYIPIEGLKNKSQYSGYSMSPNNRVLIMEIDADGGYGERDLYVSFKLNGHWTAPRNMGPVLNSFGEEYEACIAPDNVTLYYSSTGKPGYGSADVFVSRRLDDTWQNWTEPQNLGPEINSKFADAGLQVDANGQYAYMNLRTNETDKNSAICKIELPPSARPKPVVILTGHVYHAVTKAPISASVIYENMASGNEEGNTVSSADDGSFVIVLPYGMEYGFTAKANGYIGESKNINLKVDTMQNGLRQVSVDLFITPIIAGQSITLNNIFFEVSRYELKEESYPELNRLGEVMTQNPTLELLIEGHTDQGSTNTDNRTLLTLSENRAKTVKEYLVNKGIDIKRITTVGYGNTKPISKDQKLNRRVEVKVISL